MISCRGTRKTSNCSSAQTLRPELRHDRQRRWEAGIARLAGTRVITTDQAITAGCRYFLDHGTVDMDAIAVRLAVSRATLYRVMSSRDRLLAEVLWRLTSETITWAKASRTSDGVDGVIEVVRAFTRGALSSKALHRFISHEPEAAVRVLSTPAGGVQHRAIAALRGLFEETGLCGPPRDGVPGLRLVENPDDVAYLVLRIIESVCCATPLTGSQPDPDLTEESIRALLVRACTPRQSRARRFMDAGVCLVWTTLPDALLTESRLPLVIAGM
jgi:hypothetical protein